MPTPFDGKIGLWHFKGDSLGEQTIEELVATIKKWAPAADAVYVKTSDSSAWEGDFDSRVSMAINGPDDIARWVDILSQNGLDFHAWAVVRGDDHPGEIAKIVDTCRVPGVKSMILDVEPYEQFWQGSRQDVHELMTGVREQLGPDFHIGISTDPRSHHFESIFPDAWRPYVNSVHPQCYWQTMQRDPEDILTETYDVWGNYGLPIYPVLQGAASNPDSIRVAQDYARSVRGATGLSYWRLGVIGPVQFPVINEEVIDSELGPDNILRFYGWEKIIATDDVGHYDGTHTGRPTSEVFQEFTSARGHKIKYKKTEDRHDQVWSMWVPQLPETATYEVSVYIPGQHNTSKEARYHIHGISGLGSELLVRLNQSRYENQWVPLVVYDFEKNGGQMNLTDLTGEADKEIVFSAIRWRKVIEQQLPGNHSGFDAPVGTADERLTGEIWPGNWIDSTGFAEYYETVGPAYHTGADLNNNVPFHNADKDAPVYATSDGIVTYSGRGSGTWGHIIVIRHDPLPDGQTVYSRYSHVSGVTIKEGDAVERGQMICRIGNSDGMLAYHLHFDICITDVLESNPGHWPGNNLEAVLKHYTDPKKFIQLHRPAGRS